MLPVVPPAMAFGNIQIANGGFENKDEPGDE